MLTLRLFRPLIGPSLNIMETMMISNMVVALEHGVTTLCNVAFAHMVVLQRGRLDMNIACDRSKLTEYSPTYRCIDWWYPLYIRTVSASMLMHCRPCTHDICRRL